MFFNFLNGWKSTFGQANLEVFGPHKPIEIIEEDGAPLEVELIATAGSIGETQVAETSVVAETKQGEGATVTTGVATAVAAAEDPFVAIAAADTSAAVAGADVVFVAEFDAAGAAYGVANDASKLVFGAIDFAHIDFAQPLVFGGAVVATGPGYAPDASSVNAYADSDAYSSTGGSVSTTADLIAIDGDDGAVSQTALGITVA